MIHPSPDQVRWAGLAAMVGGGLGLLFAPLYSLAYFATDDGAADAKSAAVRAWADPAADALAPLLTFASADVVRLTYFKLFLLTVSGMLAGVVALHACQRPHGGRLERWGFRVTLVGLLLLFLGAASGYWPPLLDGSFAVFIAPGLLLVVIGSPFFGVGTWRAAVAPRVGAGLLIIGGPALVVISEFATLGGGLVLLYLAWVVLGYALWSATPLSPRATSTTKSGHSERSPRDRQTA
jgi:hypothetical protein